MYLVKKKTIEFCLKRVNYKLVKISRIAVQCDKTGYSESSTDDVDILLIDARVTFVPYNKILIVGNHC